MFDLALEAEKLRALGMDPIPLRPRSKAPTAPGWTKAPSLTADDFAALNGADYNIGCRTGIPGPGGLAHYCVDVDLRDGAPKEEVAAAKAALAGEFPEYESFPSVVSGSGGQSRHYHFRGPPGLKSRKLYQGKKRYVDLRGDAPRTHRCVEVELFARGKQVAMPPSIHPDTDLPYTWEHEPVGALPIVSGPPTPAAPRTPSAPPASGDDDVPPEIAPPDYRGRYLRREIIEFLDKGTYLPGKDGSASVLSAANALYRKGFNDAEVLAILANSVGGTAVAGASHRRPGDPAGQRSWLWRYACLKARDSVRRPPEVQRSTSNYFDLPGGFVSITHSASAIYKVLQQQGAAYASHGRVVGLDRRPSQGKGSKDAALQLVEMTPQRFRSFLERYGRCQKLNQHGEMVDAVCTTDQATALLASDVARETLDQIRVVAATPVLMELVGELITLGPGYHAEGEVFVLGGEVPAAVPLEEATGALLNLLRDFKFQSSGDRSRAIASLITPRLKVSGLLTDPTPADCFEADRSQAGKGYLDTLRHIIYGEAPYTIAARRGGVGNIDESLSHALLSGRAFVQYDNFRGSLDSMVLESMLTNPFECAARGVGIAEALVDASAVSVSFTSNGMVVTKDLANRLSIIRLAKQPKGYSWHAWPEGSLHDHVRHRQSYYLGCVDAVVRAWHGAGCPRNTVSDHDMRRWAGALDYIVQEYFHAAPLLHGHNALQQRIGTPQYAWLRELARAIDEAGRLGEGMTAKQILDLVEEYGVEMPDKKGDRRDERGTLLYVGRILKRIFRETPGPYAEVDGRWGLFREESELQPPSWGGDWSKPQHRYRLLSLDEADTWAICLAGG